MSSPRSRLSAAEEQKIVELYVTKVDGRWPTCTAIARDVQRSRGAVERVIEESGFVRRGTRRRLTAGEKRRIVELYQTKTGSRWTSTTEISRILGRSPTTVNQVLTQAGVAPRTVSEALRLQVSESLQQQIIHVYVATGWSYPKVAKYLGIHSSTAYTVLDRTNVIVRRGPNSQTKIRVNEARLLVDLYRQGQSTQEVADLTGRTIGVVRKLVSAAQIMRTRAEGTRLAARRRVARTKLTKIELGPLARRWIEGAEVEELAESCDVPPDVMWDALAEELSRTTTDTATCIRSCPYSCVEVCARSTAVGASKARRRY